MSTNNVEQRLAAVEAEVARLKAKIEDKEVPWTDQIYGAFAGDPLFLEAMEYGRKWRESFRPKPRKQGSRNDRPRHRSRKPAGTGGKSRS